VPSLPLKAAGVDFARWLSIAAEDSPFLRAVIESKDQQWDKPMEQIRYYYEKLEGRPLHSYSGDLEPYFAVHHSDIRLDQIRAMSSVELAKILRRDWKRRQRRAKGKIPPDRRTRPLTLREAARLMGFGGNKGGAAQLKRHIEVRALKAKKQSRQAYVFDRTDFPESNWPKLA
jgi:site-specific DNA-cytosine methylase